MPASATLLTTGCLLGMRDKPGMYFQPPYFPALCNYIYGVEDCYRHSDEPLFEELANFTDWLPKHFGIIQPSFGWRQIIQERANEDHERVQLFVDLFLQHRQECKFFWEQTGITQRSS